MTTIWELIGTIMNGIFDAMQSCTLFYGISLWDLVLLFIVLGDLAVIISTIFGTGDEIQ